jgi:hypothetical protein
MVERIRFSKTFQEDSFGARPVHVEEAVRHSDGYVDVRTPEEREAAVGDYTTVHTRAIPGKTKPEFVWIVIGVMEKGTHTALFAFRAYAGDVPIDDPSDALGALRAFATVFGLDADWATGRARFIERTRIPRDKVDKLVGFRKDGPPWLAVVPMKTLPTGDVDVSWGFLLDVNKYEESLRRRRS